MQVVVPMAGFGERFRRAGHDRPKPLVDVLGRPMIAWVLELFPGVPDPICVCASDHLAEPAWDLEEAIRTVRPLAQVVPVAPHRRGPVHSMVAALPHLRADEDVLVSVCDLMFDWDLAHFRAWVEACGADGAVVTYRGFHPHFLHSTHYGFVDEVGGWACELREKASFTADPIGRREACSNGVYWFRDPAALAAATRAVDADVASEIDGEHYPSQVLQSLLAAGARVAVYDTPHYGQWGNPRDLGEFVHHARGFSARIAPRADVPALDATLVIPAAGLGERFSREGFATPKPLVPVNGRPLVVSAAAELRACARQVFVLRADQPAVQDVRDAALAAFPAADVVVLPGPTDGQALSVLAGVDGAGVPDDEAVVVGPCDNGLSFDVAAHDAALASADVVVWTMRGHPGAAQSPAMYGWVDADDDGRVRAVSVKRALRDPATDPAIVGAFTFRRAGDLRRCVARLVARDARVNGELYLDTAIEDAIALGLRVVRFDVAHYDGWGTPDDWRTFNYWQGFFHGWAGHPYRLALDPGVPADAVGALAAGYAAARPAPPAPR